MKKILFDSVSFGDTQLEFILDTAEAFSKRPNCEVIVLDRGNIKSRRTLTYLTFPSYSPHRFTADDSILLQRICNHVGADLFLSVLTTPLTTPMLLIVSNNESCLPTSSRVMMEYDLATTYAIAILAQDPVAVKHILANKNTMATKLIFDLPGVYGGMLDNQNLSTLIAQRSHSFYKDWNLLRRLQSKVDTVIWDPQELNVI